MKKKLFLSLSIAALVSLMVPFAFKSGTPHSVSAYSVTSLPTDIDLNDTSETDIRSYYSSLNSLTSSERKGTNLLKNLKPILKSNQKYYSYDSSNYQIWKMYEITDRDWEKSPASEIDGYDSKTNTISDYSYQSTDPYVHALYVNRNVDNLTTAYSDHQQTQWGINREHVWPKSAGFAKEGDGGARGDPMHLMAGNGRVNGTEHNNYVYGYVDENKIESTPSFYNLQGNLRVTSKTLGDGTVFEPQDSDKGDIARALFYMVARYNYLSGEDVDGINQNNPNLELVESTDRPSAFTSSETETGKLGLITDLLEWNRIDPPDEYEIHRNNLLYTNFTNNRNPFIDFPEWADYVWGSASGYAQPASDPINGSSTPTGTVTLSKSSISLDVGESTTISATSSDNSAISWSVADTSVATISSHVSISGYSITVNIVGSGTTTLTASATIDGVQVSKSCSIEGTIPVVNVTSVTLDKQEITLNVGDTYQLNATVLPENATNKNVSWSRSGYAASVDNNGLVTANFAGTSTITVTTEDGNKTASCTVTVVVPVTSIEISKSTLELEVGDSESLSITVLPSNATNKNVTWSTSNENVANVDENGTVTAVANGSAVITVTTVDGNLSDTCNVSVSTKPISESIKITTSELGYENGEAVESIEFYSKNSETIIGTFAKGANKNNGPKYYNYGQAIRMYGSNSLTITSSKENITKIVLGFGSGDGSNEITSDKGTYDDGTWTTSILVDSVTLTIGGTTGHRKIASIEVFYFGAISFSSYFLNNVTCDASGETPPTGVEWSTIESKYNLLFISDQSTLLSSSADKSGTEIEQAMAKYDYIVAKYGVDEYKDFITREPEPLLIATSNDIDASYNVIIVISVITASSVLLCTCILIKKIKHK